MSWVEVIGVIKTTQEALRTWHDQRNFFDLWGVAAMRVTPSDLAADYSPLLAKAQIASTITDDSHPQLPSILRTLVILRDQFIPQLFNHQNTHIVFANTIQNVQNQMDDILGGEGLNKAMATPKQFAAKLRSASTILESTLSNLDNINEKIRTIKAAHDAAVDLPVTLKEIEDAKSQLDATKTLSAARIGELETLLKKGTSVLGDIKLQSKEVDTVTSRVLDSYRALTSQGLAQAFHAKETKLNSSMAVWVGVLVLCLLLMTGIGYVRFPEIQNALSGQIRGSIETTATVLNAAKGKAQFSAEPHWGVVLVEVVLAILSLGPPTWLAIVSTKQISQRFKLAEDYGYKAAVSAAYEGYRSEASRYGEEFQTKLFASALDRLDEQPLRFVDHDSGGSPLHELLSTLGKSVDPKSLKEFLEKFSSSLVPAKSAENKPGKSEAPNED